MYSTCLFCNRALGSNEALEHFPVGRRLAFDSAKGRLWVICPSCTRWNLTPLEERWEAVEEAERLFRASRLRVSTDNIGLARVADGTDLVRVGSPERPELAAWRYGEQFTRRRRKYLIVAGVGAVAGAALIGGGLTAGVGVVSAVQMGSLLWKTSQRGLPLSVIARFHGQQGALVTVRRKHLRTTMIDVDSDGGLAINVSQGKKNVRVEGLAARRVAASLFLAVNYGGGKKEDVESAVERLARAGGAEEFLGGIARTGARLTNVLPEKSLFKRDISMKEPPPTGLLALGKTLSLAIEMALHEEQERRALEGELVELEEAWREAEEIGAIADDMFLPAGIERTLDRLRGR